MSEPKVSNLPEIIHLCLGIDDDDNVDFRDLSEVSWCEDRIDGHDPAYVRHDLSASLEAEAGALRAHLTNVLSSATPNERDNPTMFAAWKAAREFLAGKGAGE